MKFLRDLVARYRRKAALFPQIYDPMRAGGIRSIRQFDDRVTAFYSGFTGADDYYHRAAAARVLDRITIPTLILNAADDPFLRILPDSREKIAANPNISFFESNHGGHCAFLATPVDGYDGYWAEHTLLRFLLSKTTT
jgi:predicted alpha/beta-fold hydrolase